MKNIPLYRRRTVSTLVMFIKSSESIPVEAMPECNAYEVLWNRHEQAECPDDLIIHIEGASGEQRTYEEFRTRVVLGATALDRSFSAENAEMIAIISHSSSVRFRERFLSSEILLFTLISRTVLHLSIPCFFSLCRSFCSILAGHPPNSSMP